jgi:hypothetical protein
VSHADPLSMTIENSFLVRRLTQLLTHWQKNLPKMPSKLLLPLQDPSDSSPYFSVLFREKYRRTLELIRTAATSSSFLIYSAIFQHNEALNPSSKSRYFVHHLALLNPTDRITLDLPRRHERTVSTHEFLGDLHPYIDAVEQLDSHPHVIPTGKSNAQTENSNNSF